MVCAGATDGAEDSSGAARRTTMTHGDELDALDPEPTPSAAQDRARRLRGAACFGALGTEDAAKLARESRIRRLDEGERLWRAGAPGAGFALVQDGLVLISATRADGDRAVFGLFGPGECVGIAAALDGSPYPADAIAFTKHLEVLWIAAPALRLLASASPSVARAIQQALLAHTSALRIKIEILSAGKVPARIASLLLHLAERFGAPAPAPRGAVRVELPISRQALAQLVSARSETVIRILGAWRREGVVESDVRGFTLRDLDTLRAARGELAPGTSRRAARDLSRD